MRNASAMIIGHQKSSRRIHSGLVATIRKISALMAVPIASKFKKISSKTRLTATKKLKTFTREREDKVEF